MDLEQIATQKEIPEEQAILGKLKEAPVGSPQLIAATIVGRIIALKSEVQRLLGQPKNEYPLTDESSRGMMESYRRTMEVEIGTLQAQDTLLRAQLPGYSEQAKTFQDLFDNLSDHYRLRSVKTKNINLKTPLMQFVESRIQKKY